MTDIKKRLNAKWNNKEQQNKEYYVFAIWNKDLIFEEGEVFPTIFSDNKDKPILPEGFTHYAYIGTIKNN